MKTNEKLDLLLRVNTLSDPNIEDIRMVRAIGIKRIDLSSRKPLVMFLKRYVKMGKSPSETFKKSQEIFSSSFSGRRNRFREPIRVSLTSCIRQFYFNHSKVIK